MSQDGVRSSAAHSPLPWQVSGIRISGVRFAKERFLQVGPDGAATVFVIYSDRTPKDHLQSHGDAALIVRAVNRDHLFTEMLEALKHIADGTAFKCDSEGTCISDARSVALAAIAKAEGAVKREEAV